MQEPSFGRIFRIVWKVFFAILLIPALLLLGYVALRVIPGQIFAIGLAIAILIGWIVVTKWMHR